MMYSDANHSLFLFRIRINSLFLIAATFLLNPFAYAQVVINEIHYNPDVKTERIEFVELYNAGSDEIDLSGWSVQNAIDFTFPNPTEFPANTYMIVCEDVAAFRSKFGTPTQITHGPFEGKLDNFNDTVVLKDAVGNEIDRVEYTLGFPWPTVGDSVPDTTPGRGHSIQLINPLADNDLGGSWRSGAPSPNKQNETYAGNTPPQIR